MVVRQGQSFKWVLIGQETGDCDAIGTKIVGDASCAVNAYVILEHSEASRMVPSLHTSTLLGFYSFRGFIKIGVWYHRPPRGHC